jgi:hypothetical protein
MFLAAMLVDEFIGALCEVLYSKVDLKGTVLFPYRKAGLYTHDWSDVMADSPVYSNHGYFRITVTSESRLLPNLLINTSLVQSRFDIE